MKEDMKRSSIKAQGNVPQKRKKAFENDTLMQSNVASNTLPTPPASTVKTKCPRLSLSATTNTTDESTFTTTSRRAVLEALITAPTTTTSTSATPSTPQTPSKQTTRKSRIPTDPINISIYTLRQQTLDWDEIALRTNQACGLLGSDGELTACAVYSRFFRNGPLVAKARAEEWKREWYVHMKKAVSFDGEGGDGGDGDGEVAEDGSGNEKAGVEGVGSVAAVQMSEAEKHEVVKAVEKAQQEFWTQVTAVVNASLGGGKQLTEEQVREVYDRLKDGDE